MNQTATGSPQDLRLQEGERMFKNYYMTRSMYLALKEKMSDKEIISYIHSTFRIRGEIISIIIKD